MCTVTYIPGNDSRGFVLTSNRDEKTFRPTIAPKIYDKAGIKICFPKDMEAGGSWIAVSNMNRLCCLLNGAYEPHEKQAYHTESRGNILIEAVSFFNSVGDYYEAKDFDKVQPFTILTLEHENNIVTHFSEFIWDGQVKNYRQLPPDKPYIWSSVTLYSKKNRERREHWFNNFLLTNTGNLSTEQIFSFHSGRHTPDDTVNLVMKRDNNLKTVSITQVTTLGGKFRMKYQDLLEQKNYQLEI